MTDAQVSAIFTHMSSNTMKLMQAHQVDAQYTTYALCGMLIALILAVTWKG